MVRTYKRKTPKQLTLMEFNFVYSHSPLARRIVESIIAVHNTSPFHFYEVPMAHSPYAKRIFHNMVDNAVITKAADNAYQLNLKV